MSTLTSDSCAKLLNCSKVHLLNLVRQGKIPAAKVGKAYVFIEADIIEWLRVKSTPRPVPEPRKVGRPRKRIVCTQN